jgi:hypothetical protein
LKGKRRIRFSLAALFVAITLFGVVFAPLAKYVRERIAVDRAIRSVRSAGGESYSDWRSVSHRDYVELLNGRFKRVGTRFEIDEDRLRSEDGSLTIAQRLFLFAVAVPPEDIACVKLTGDKIDDQCLSVIVKDLKPCSRLRVLLLSETRVTDNGLKAIAQLRQIRVIGLHKNSNSKRGALELVKSLPECSFVCDSLPETRISSSGKN